MRCDGDQTTISYIEENTSIASPPLCPELKLRLLKKDAPLIKAAPLSRGEPHIFDWDGPRPYWAFAWGSGQALARYIFDHPDLVNGKSVVDFGAGSGIAGIAAAMNGALTVHATDIDPMAVQAVVLNAALNHATVSATVVDGVGPDMPACDILFAGDVFYLNQSQNERMLWEMVRHKKTIVVADPPCRGFTKVNVVELARFKVRTFPELEHRSITEACIFRLSMRPAQ